MLSRRRAHTALPTHDVDALRPFYEEVLGFVPRAVRTGAVVYDAGEGSIFAISRSGAPSTSTHTQMAFTVPDIEAAVATSARGVVFEAYETPKTEGGIAKIGPGAPPGSRTRTATCSRSSSSTTRSDRRRGRASEIQRSARPRARRSRRRGTSPCAIKGRGSCRG